MLLSEIIVKDRVRRGSTMEDKIVLIRSSKDT